MNMLKTFLLLSMLTLMLIWAGGALGGRTGLTIALIFALAMNFFAYWFSDKIVLAMYRAKAVTEEQAPVLYHIVRNLSMRAELPMPKVYIINQDQPNAFATGRNPKHAAVAVTKGITNILTQDELAGVIAHELAHIKHRDILISTVAATIAGAISYLAHMAQWALIFGGLGRDDDEGGNPLITVIMILIVPIAAMIIQMAVSRSREYAADEGGAKIAGSPRLLAGALRKLHYASQKIPMRTNEATAHMFIINPLSGKSILKLFSTHPPLEERIKRLESMSL